MKRVREEKDEGRSRSQSRLRPWRRPQLLTTAVATPSLTVERPVMTWDDAVDFMLSVRSAFDTAKYHEFLYAICLRFSIGVKGMADHMKVVLRGHPDLKRRFNMFLPAQYEISLSDDDDQQEGAPAPDSLQGRSAQRD